MKNRIEKAFVFAAGRGTRFKPYSSTMPKPLFEVNGVPLVRRSIDQISTAFPNLTNIYILIRDSEIEFKNALKSNPCFFKIRFLKVPENLIKKGLIGGFAFLDDYLEDNELFLSILGDEFYGGNDHKLFADFIENSINIAGVCGVKQFSYPEEYLKNYSVKMDKKNNIINIKEKPDSINSKFFGLGILVAKGSLCKIAKHSIKQKFKKELFNLLIETQNSSEPLLGFEFKDVYVNINTPSDIYNCLRQIRKIEKKNIDVIIHQMD